MFVRGGVSNSSVSESAKINSKNTSNSKNNDEPDLPIPSLLDTMDPELIPEKFRRIEANQLPKKGLLGDFPLQKVKDQAFEDADQKDSEGEQKVYGEDLPSKISPQEFSNNQDNNQMKQQFQQKQQQHIQQNQQQQMQPQNQHQMHQQQHQHMQQQPPPPPMFPPFNNRFFNPANIPSFIDAHFNPIRPPFPRAGPPFRHPFYPPRYPNMRFRPDFTNLPRNQMHPPKLLENKPQQADMMDNKGDFEKKNEAPKMLMPKNNKT